MRKDTGLESGPTRSFLNAARAAPIKANGRKKDLTDLTCHYCNKKGHIKLKCWKKKRNEVQKKKKEKAASSSSSSSGTKATNLHILVSTTTTIMEVEDNEITVSLYTAAKQRWMLDSGVT